MNTLPEYNYKTLIPVRFADIDAFGHVNNAVYLTYFEIARSKYWHEVVQWDWNELGIIIAKAEINYIKPLILEDELFAYVRTARIGNTSFDLDYTLVRTVNGNEEICATGKTVCVAYNYGLNEPAPIPETRRIKMQEFEAIS